MFQKLTRSVAFLAAFAMGLTAFAVFRTVITGQADSIKKAETASVDKRRSVERPIEVRFDSFETEDGNEFAVFSVTNFTEQTYRYSTYNKNKSSLDREIWTEIEVGGKRNLTRWCGTGVTQGDIEPGETIYSRVDLTSISYNYKKRQMVRVGYSFYLDMPSVDQIYWSDQLPVSAELEKWLLKEKRRISAS